MTKVYLQPGLRGLSGGMGDWVYSVRKGKTVLGMKPIKTAEPSPAQIGQQGRFKQAVVFAKAALANTTLRAFYGPIAAERELSTYALAIADYLTAPSVDAIGLENFTGKVGDSISILASDSVGVAKVSVGLTDLNTGQSIEDGWAVETAPGSGEWIYTTTKAVLAGTNVVIQVTAVDNPGNTGSLSNTKTI